MTSIIDFLRDRFGEIEATARAAVDPDRPGTTWQWVTDKTDTPVVPGDLEDALRHQPVSLRTVEEFPTTSGNLPAFVIYDVQEIIPGAGDHIALHDPAYVLADITAKRKILALHEETAHRECRLCEPRDPEWPCRTLRLLALPFASHPDFDEKWRT